MATTSMESNTLETLLTNLSLGEEIAATILSNLIDIKA